MMRKESGFTALELSVTLGIIAIIAALTMPPYLKWSRESRLRSAVSNLTSDLEMGRTRAIRDNAYVVIEFFTDGYSIFVDNSEDWNQNGSEDTLQSRTLPPGVRIDTASLSFPGPDPEKTRFNGRGIPPDVVTPAIWVENANDSRQITINRLGNIDVQ
jgi:type IV fimbrial biogenesis protein FimT